jgi:hypothetical protein
MSRTITKRKVNLVGVVGPQTLRDTELVSLFTDNESEFPIVKDRKGSRLVGLIGHRVEIEGDLIYRWPEREMQLKVNRFQLSEMEDFDPMERTLEPSLPAWDLMPIYA